MAETIEMAEVTVTPFILAIAGDKLVKLAEIPAEDAEGFVEIFEGVKFITQETVDSLTKEQLGELYGRVAGTPAKKFKDKAIAVESLAYQTSKMSTFDPSAPKAAAPAPAAKGEKAPKPKKEKAEPRAIKYELLTPADPEASLKSLPPQAVALVSAMTDVVKSKGSQEFLGSELEARLTAADSPLTTKQPAMRIFSYYLGKLRDAGFLKKE